MATSLTTDALLVAGLAFVYSAERLFVVMPVGVYVDRVGRRTILWITNLSRAALLVVMAVLFVTLARRNWISAEHDQLPLESQSTMVRVGSK